MNLARANDQAAWEWRVTSLPSYPKRIQKGAILACLMYILQFLLLMNVKTILAITRYYISAFNDS